MKQKSLDVINQFGFDWDVNSDSNLIEMVRQVLDIENDDDVY
jgi:hypothetical protein